MADFNILTAQESLRQQLAPVSETASQDAQVLLASILAKPRSWIMAHPEAKLDAGHERSLKRVLSRLKKGEPLPYILGHWEFYGIDLNVSPAVLIPRPETELLVDEALDWLNANPERRFAADVGTGSGCIAIALAANIPDLRVVASDISPEALAIACKNFARHQLAERIFPVRLDLLNGVCPPPQKRFDLICANLPYLPRATLDSLNQLRWEPGTALNGGSSGTDLIQRLLADIPQVIQPGSLLLIEIEASLGASTCSLVKSALPAADVRLRSDLAGHDRLVIVQI